MTHNHTIDVEAERKLFEAAARNDPYAIYSFMLFGNGHISADVRTYLDTKTEAAWGIWLAAKRSTPAVNAGTIDSDEFRKLAMAWSDAATECWPSKTLDGWNALIAHIDARLNAAAVDRNAASPAAPAGQRDAAGGGWISVDERLPDDSGDVLVLYWPYDNHENSQIVGQAHYHDGGFYNDDGDDWHPPSHWMPLPTAPEVSASPVPRNNTKGESNV